MAAVFALIDVVLLASLSDRQALFCEGCRAAVALSFVVELRLVRPPPWEATLPRLPEGGRGGGGGRSRGRHKAARPASAFAPHPRDGQVGAYVADLDQSIGGLRHKRFNSNHGDGGPPREGGGSGGGAGGPRASVRRLGRSPLLRGVFAVFVFRYATGIKFSAAEARLTVRLVNIASALAALHLGASPWSTRSTCCR